eukprot:gene28902-biopygen18485
MCRAFTARTPMMENAMRFAPLTVALLLAGSACSAAPQQSGQAGAASPAPLKTLPRNAPDYGVTNVPATTGRANLPETAPPFASAVLATFDQPFAMAFLPRGDLLVTEKAGKLKVLTVDRKIAEITGVPAGASGRTSGR